MKTKDRTVSKFAAECAVKAEIEHINSRISQLEEEIDRLINQRSVILKAQATDIDRWQG